MQELLLALLIVLLLTMTSNFRLRSLPKQLELGAPDSSKDQHEVLRFILNGHLFDCQEAMYWQFVVDAVHGRLRQEVLRRAVPPQRLTSLRRQDPTEPERVLPSSSWNLADAPILHPKLVCPPCSSPVHRSSRISADRLEGGCC